MILDGKVVAQHIYQNLKNEITSRTSKPKLCVIVVGKNSASLKYIAQKQKWADVVWIDFEIFSFPLDVTEQEILDTIHRLNNDSWVHGYIVQLPLPKHIDTTIITNAILPIKDVDGFHSENQWKVVIGDDSWLPACTPAGVMELLKYYNIDVVWKKVTIIGRSNIVGKPLANMLINASATVTSCNSRTKNIEFHTKNADIVITALWVPHFLKADMISKDAIVIDVGFTIQDGKIFWDCDFENISKQGNSITPVPGWVGALTVASLLKNTLKTYYLQTKI